MAAPVRTGWTRRPGRRTPRVGVALIACLSLLAGPAAAVASPQDGSESSSNLRIGVIALAQAISAVAQTPEFAEPLPFTQTSLADVLDLDQELVGDLSTALEGTDLETALESLPGIGDVALSEVDGAMRATFDYAREVEDHVLGLVHDDGDLRFGGGAEAGQLDVTLATDPDAPFVMEFDPDQPDPLLQVALVSRPVMDLTVDIDTEKLAGFGARQGFTEVDITGGRYRIDRERRITMRDPNGRGVLTLEDLRYATLPDLFAVASVEGADEQVDVAFAVQLPSDSIAGGSEAQRAGTLTLDGTPEGAVWPAASDAREEYGDALKAATGLSTVDGVTSLAKYTGATLALQNAAEVEFPNVAGSTTDLFAPGDQLLELLATAAVAQIRCGAAPGNPPVGIAAPGDTVYCSASTADGIGSIVTVDWQTNGDGDVVDDAVGELAAVGPDPAGTVRIDNSDGEPDVSITLTLKDGRVLTARSMPHTVQDVVARIDGFNEASTAGATIDLDADRLDVDVALVEEKATAELGLGNPRTLGALVGLTGLGGSDAGTATVTATKASYRVGFGIATGAVDPDAGEARETVLLPAADHPLVEIGGLAATRPNVIDLPARVGFLGVTADLTGLSLGASGASAVVLDRPEDESGPLRLDTLLNEAGALDPDQVTLTSTVTAGVSFAATEEQLPGGGFATGVNGPAVGGAAITWTPDALPTVTFDPGYRDLRVFDPVPAAFLSGTARVTEGEPFDPGPDETWGTEDDGSPDRVTVDVDLSDDPDDPADDDLYEVLGVARPSEREEGEDTTAQTEVARRLLAAGPACQNVTLVDGDTLTCAGLAPSGVAAFDEGAPVELIVLGDPFSLRDGIIEGLAATLAAFDRLAGDNVDDELTDDQYTSTLPLVDLTPSQLAVERAALGAGLDKLALAATEDESGTSGTRPGVSSAQELSTAVDALFGSANAPSLAYRLGGAMLGVDLAASAPSGTMLQAPLRFTVNGPGQVGSVVEGGATPRAFDVDVSSTTRLAIDVAIATARPVVSDGTNTISTATLDLGDELTGISLQAGIGDFTVLAGSAAALDVTVATEFEPAADAAVGGQLQTTRKTDEGFSDLDHPDLSPEAIADLRVGESDPLHVHAAATDSSGGAGAAQPAPEAMQVRYAAEGLDGLAAALEGAMDGAAPRNLSAEGAPVAAPLIGSDLDAGAGVADTLRDLTSALRTQLGDVGADVTADALPDALETAMKAAVDGTVGLDEIAASDVSATVECVGDTCETCTTPEDGGQEECTSLGSTAWETVSISAALTGSTNSDGKVPFDTGLPGLEVRSDEEVDTTTSWTLPITLELVRGVGPRIRIDDGDALTIEVSATMPESLPAIVGYLVADLTAKAADRSIDTTITITPDVPEGGAAYDLFALYDGELTAQPTFAEGPEDGLSLDFETRKDAGSPLHLLGTIVIPWTPDGGYGTVAYQRVRMDVGQVAATAGKPFEVIDPYLAPIRDVVDTLRTRIPVVSDLSELGGGDEISLLSLLETLSSATQNPNLTLAHNVIRLTDGVARLVEGMGTLVTEEPTLERLSKTLGTALTLEPTEVQVYEKCTQTVRGKATTSTRTGKPTCPTVDELAKRQQSKGVQSQTTNSRRRGNRPDLRPNVGRTVKQVSVQMPGFSLPFLADPNQVMDVLTAQGDASYFRLDLGTLAAEVSYTQTFGPIMAGPVPISPFVGGSIGIEGRLAMGFDSRPQSLAVEALPHPGDVNALVRTWDQYSVVEEGFYLDDLDADGEDVPEVKLVTTLEAGAGVSIGIVSAGLKGGITLTIGLDLNDPNNDGRLRAVEIRNIFDGNAACIFDAKGELEAFIAIFVRIWVLAAPVEFDFDLLRLGPWTLFEYGCKDEVPQLVTWDSGTLALTSGNRSTSRIGGADDVADEYEVRQFDNGGGAAAGGTTTYEVDGFGRVQRVVVSPNDATTEADYRVVIHQSGISLSTDVVDTQVTTHLPTFTADGGADDDRLSFLTGETFNDQQQLITTPFTTPVVGLTGGPGSDLLVTGAADDVDVDGGPGDDSIDLGQGDDQADGGDGNDTVSGGSGWDDLAGGLGHDRLEGGPGADRADGGAGNDGLVGGPGRDVRAVLVLPNGENGGVVEQQVRLGFDSGDVLVGGDGTDTVDGGDGSDVVVGGDGAYTAEDGSLLSLSTDEMGGLFHGGTRTVNVLTQSGNGTSEPTDVTVMTARTPGGRELDDLCRSGTPLTGKTGGDFVTGGAEADVVIGGNGPDRLDGGSGPDEVCGRAGDDLASGDGGDVDEGSNRDVVRGGTGDDSLDAGAGPDVVFGDDVDLFRGGGRVLDGSLGGTGAGEGADHLDGGEGDDVLSGGGGSDLLLGGPGDDDSSGEGRDTASVGGGAPPLDERLLACNGTTRVVEGHVDLNGDLLAGTTGSGITEDDGRLAGLAVDDGVVHGPGGSTPYDGLLGADAVVVGGRIDLDRDGTAGAGDSGIIPLASMLATSGSNPDGDCILSQDGDDQLRGGLGSDFLGAGEGRDLALGGDGNDLAVGGSGTDVLLGGPHHDVLVGGEGDDHLQGEDGGDRLRGNEGDDDLVGGSDTSGADDGQDVLLGARGQDVLVAENGAPVSAAIVDGLTGVDAPAWAGDADVPLSVLAGEDADLRFDDSAVTCGGEPSRWVTVLAADGSAGTPAQSPGTPLAYDELYGGYGCDWAFGSPGDDLVRGGQDDDVVEGGPGDDIVHGDAGDDAVVGGSSVDPAKDVAVTRTRSGDGVSDGADAIFGDGGPDGEVGSDLLLGDNATVNLVPLAAETSLFDLVRAVVATVPTWTVQLADVPMTATPDGGTTVDDVIDGGGEVGTGDHAFGQEGSDTITTGAGDDYVEGNSGTDTLATGAGNDDVIGGSSAADGQPLGPDGDRLAATLTADPFDVSAAGVEDAGDQVDAGAGDDIVLGDNGRITHPSGIARGRHVAMADPGSGTTSGVDELRGGVGDDRLYGQGDDDDIDAGTGDDYVEGNTGTDRIVGQDGDDVLIGGSSVDPTGTTAVADLPDTGPDTDGDDTLLGMAGHDLLLGDNATVHQSVGDPALAVRLGDVVASRDTGDADARGDDTMVGGPGADRMFGQGGDDVIGVDPVSEAVSEAGDDYVEGNEGADTIATGDGDDDVLGGSSAADGRPLGGDGLRLTEDVDDLDASAGEVRDGIDTIDAGAGQDVVLGDNGRVTRPGGTLTSGPSDDRATQPVRDTAMADTSDGDTSGSDVVTGGAGHDVVLGQFDDGDALGTGDRLFGDAGDDVLLGDLGVVTLVPAEDLGDDQELTTKAGGILERVYAVGSLVPVTVVPGDPTVGGPDLVRGGDGADVLRLGAGRDLGNGDAGDDVVFGGADDDALWGGVDHDRVFGGYGADDLDLKARADDPVAWAKARGEEDDDGKAGTTNGLDLVYGGWGPDELQADVGGPSPRAASDHLIDWVGAYNVYYVCDGAYGGGRVIRRSSPDMVDLLLALTRAAGGLDVATSGSGAWYDLGLVERGHYNQNNGKSPDYPGNFTCEGG